MVEAIKWIAPHQAEYITNVQQGKGAVYFQTVTWVNKVLFLQNQIWGFLERWQNGFSEFFVFVSTEERTVMVVSSYGEAWLMCTIWFGSCVTSSDLEF